MGRGNKPAGRANGNHQATSDEEEHEAAPPAPRTSRRAGRVDFSKLETASLNKYRKVYQLRDVAQNSTKEELIPAVARHFASQTVDEEDTLLNFTLALKKHSLNNKASPQAAKKPRHASKPKGR
mmetsp:Transcript_31639/g.81075  ORF Transcript_31639/g.81075 Transcript_31639/m.81075 type:complete len:124 (-) Transcript_31639:93-464(-)|eukprot:jgi/Tetstr1/465310/TSEL_010007.t1